MSGAGFDPESLDRALAVELARETVERAERYLRWRQRKGEFAPPRPLRWWELLPGSPLRFPAIPYRPDPPSLIELRHAVTLLRQHGVKTPAMDKMS